MQQARLCQPTSVTAHQTTDDGRGTWRTAGPTDQTMAHRQASRGEQAVLELFGVTPVPVDEATICRSTCLTPHGQPSVGAAFGSSIRYAGLSAEAERVSFPAPFVYRWVVVIASCPSSRISV